MWTRKIYFSEKTMYVSRLEDEAERVALEVIRNLAEIHDDEEHEILIVFPKPNTWERYVKKHLLPKLNAKEEWHFYQHMFNSGPERVQAVSCAWSGQINGRSYRLEIREKVYYDCSPREIPNYTIDERIRMLVNPAECW